MAFRKHFEGHLKAFMIGTLEINRKIVLSFLKRHLPTVITELHKQFAFDFILVLNSLSTNARYLLSF